MAPATENKQKLKLETQSETGTEKNNETKL